MKTKYAKKLNNANILLGTHIAFKLVIILILFVILYTSIWIQEKYLIYIKVSVYIQIFIFLSLSMVMLVLNNPHSMDICSTFVNYFYLIGSILEFGIIVIELAFLIQNLNNFLKPFHDCPYYRTYQDITDLDYKRTCLYYSTDVNNELPYKYICYYNSEDEYFNSFCDGLICKKNNNKDEINSFVKCYKNVDKNDIKFSLDNEFYLKEFELVYKYKSSNLYTCFRKNKIEKIENIFNEKCPDSNPVKKMIIFIYTLFILHFLIDFLFIYELLIIKKIKQMYLDLVNQVNVIPVNILSNQDDINYQNFFNNSNSNNKQTYNTDNMNTVAYPSYQMPKENSQSIIIVPGYKDSEIEDIRSNFTEQESNTTDINKPSKDKLYQYENIIVHYNQNDENANNGEKAENDCVINRKVKIFNNINNEIDKNRRNSKQQLIDADVDSNKEDEYSINRINFFIDNQKTKKKENKKNDIKNEMKDNNINIDNNNNNYNVNINGNKNNNINMNQIQPLYKINNNINNNTRNQNLQNYKMSSKDYNSLDHLYDTQKNDITKKIKKSSKSKNKDNIKNINLNNFGFDKESELIESNLNIDELKNNYEDKIVDNNNNENQNNNNSWKLKEIMGSTIQLKDEENYNEGKENISDNFHNKNEITKHNMLNNIHINKEDLKEYEDYENNGQNLIKINRTDN